MSSTIYLDALTRSVEDYLKAIYRISDSGHTASTSQIAQVLDLTPPSVSGMVKRLSEQGLLERVPYHGVQLTPEGRRAALRMLRRHRLIEAYLVEFLGYTWDTVHAEAERLEHAVSDGLVERMATALGNPQFDPHGDPIPDSEGGIAEPAYIRLADLSVGETAEIRRVDTSQSDRLRYIESSGLKPGAVVTVADRQPFRGPITLRIGVRQQVIGDEMAQLLLCARPVTA